MKFSAKIVLLLYLSMVECKSQPSADQSYTAFTGATIIDGRGGEPIRDAVLVIRNGRIVSIGTKENVGVPAKASVVDASGKFIMPGIINAHGHVGDVQGIEGGHYSTQNIIDNLATYARYGITTVVSLGGDQSEAVPLRAVNDSSATQRARLFIAGEVITGETPAEAVAVIRKNAKMGVDWMKIRVDDNLGTSPKMTETVYRAVIKRSHELGYKIATHMYYLADAKKLLKAGSDFLAHSVRDLPVDEEFIQLIKAKNVGYCPTLTRELSTFVYGDTAAFFSDPYFLQEYDQATIEPLLDPASQKKVRGSRAAQMYEQQLPTAMANLKTLQDQGVPIVFGTDSGIPKRFMGYFEQLEMEMMAEAGLTPMQIIKSATKNAAEFMNLKDLGTLSKGHWADFLILDADPLADIRNVRKISGVYIGGEKVERKN
ncbi:amidohydrolase family protein [Persicitalea jodogahamensis]|uniref:Organophopsphate acid anhydrase n=1 Tax=Persicitalea jodogahamensis TaxID=402147 RepID=A0A8J3D4C6_9BACT|nr:amidohydrolase family protein [Persicitalea jodogahamensis]GHB73143.1 organophopsphate acid anhydrase [Persicitalea jodogahamensis]